MAKKKNVIITGAAGLVGTILRQHWGNHYTLRLADIRPVENLQADEEFAQLNITDLDAFTAACQDMDVLVHLAADRRPKADFYETLLNLNIIGGYNGFEAARRAGCQRIVFASSINAVLGYQCRPRCIGVIKAHVLPFLPSFPFLSVLLDLPPQGCQLPFRFDS